MPLAHAQVFKCTEADGKTVYSQAPCTKADNKEKLVKLMDAPLTDSASSGGSDGRSNYSYNQAANTSPAPQTPSRQTLQSDRMRSYQQKPVNLGPSNQQLIAECEANHGARCSSAAEINYRRQLATTPTPQQQANIQNAVRARREREEAEIRNRFRR